MKNDRNMYISEEASVAISHSRLRRGSDFMMKLLLRLNKILMITFVLQEPNEARDRAIKICPISFILTHFLLQSVLLSKFCRAGRINVL